MTDPILHTSLSRDATPAEIAADGQALSRIRQMFPPRSTIMTLAPDNARAYLESWVPCLEAGLHHCETLAGISALMKASDALSALEITRDLTGIREKISEAFDHIETEAVRLSPPDNLVMAA